MTMTMKEKLMKAVDLLFDLTKLLINLIKTVQGEEGYNFSNVG